MALKCCHFPHTVQPHTVHCCKDKQLYKVLRTQVSRERAAEYNRGVGISDNGRRTMCLPKAKVERSSTFREPGRGAKADES